MRKAESTPVCCFNAVDFRLSHIGSQPDGTTAQYLCRFVALGFTARQGEGRIAKGAGHFGPDPFVQVSVQNLGIRRRCGEACIELGKER